MANKLLKQRNQNLSQPEPNEGLPASLEIEKALLGLIFLNDLAYHELIGAGLNIDYFSRESNRLIFHVIQDMVTGHKQISLLMVVEELERMGYLGRVGGAAYVGDLLVSAPEASGTKYLAEYVSVLNEKYLRRQTIFTANRVAACAMDPSDDIRTTVSMSTEDLLRLQGATTNEPADFVAQTTAPVLKDVTELMYVEREVIGVSYGIRDLDNDTTGMRDGEITVVGGYPGSAKTAFALNVCRMAARDVGPVVFFSLEMTKEQLVLRLFAQESDISYSKLRNPRNLSGAERKELDFWKERIDALPLIIDDTARKIEEIIPRAHLYLRKYKARLVAIDYLQLIQAPGEKEYDQVSAASDAIWWLEKTTQVPILLLSQLSRPEGRNRGGTQPPNLHMLRSSGKIEQNAHNVLLLHRGYDDEGAPTGEDLIVIAKQRAGMVGRVKARFNGTAQRWEDAGGLAPVVSQGTIFNTGGIQ
jgi:replicative DNA helicase